MLIPLTEEGFGFRQFQAHSPAIIGQFVEAEVWHDGQDAAREISYAWTTNGLLEWIAFLNNAPGGLRFTENGTSRVMIWNGGSPRWLT